ncbi:MAG: crotonase [Propionibacterium sp.]|nr:crotonase [Propionibacterium sp.]
MSDLVVDVGDGVALLTLNRPDKRNAYSTAMGRLLNEAYRDLDADDAVRAIVLTGAGDAFCAGADFGTDPFAAPEDAQAFSASPTDPAAFELRTPVIAAVNGHAIGIGFTLALHADIRVMASNAKYAVIQARRGVLGDCMSHWTLPRIAGAAVAADLLLTGRTFGGAEAARLGIATETVPNAEVLDRALTIAADIATHVAPMSAALSKRILWDCLEHGYSARQVAELETEAHHRVMGKPDAREGVRAFLERREPRWSASVAEEWQPLPKPDGD